jgi:hypothetical protein
MKSRISNGNITVEIGESSFNHLVGSSDGIHAESDGKTGVVGLDQVRLIESIINNR